MSKYRQAAKIDNNQNKIVKALRAIPGVTVAPNHDDLLVGYKGRTYWFEVKNPDKLSKKGNYLIDSARKDSQRNLEREWEGHYRVVWSLEQILLDLGIA